MPHYSTDLIPTYLVRGVCDVDVDGSQRRFRVSRLVSAPTPAVARARALARIELTARGQKARWKEVSSQWIANQYMWQFEEEAEEEEAARV